MQVRDRQNENIRTIGRVIYELGRRARRQRRIPSVNGCPACGCRSIRRRALSASTRNASPKPRDCASYHVTASSSSARATASSLIVTCLCISQALRRAELRAFRHAEMRPGVPQPRPSTRDRFPDRERPGSRTDARPASNARTEFRLVARAESSLLASFIE